MTSAPGLSRYERGLARQAELSDPHGPRDRAYRSISDLAPDLPRLAVEFAYGDIHARPGLDAARRELVILGVLIAQGGVEPQLEAHLGAALAAGLTPDELVEAIMQAVPYAGFPRVFGAMAVARRAFEARGLLRKDAGVSPSP
ncbi:carboxymuconolactone decarboxylase family protein [Actinomadura gamaensis]|uniref:Carboxymuconolactone decarboxylase family protein n=1 Tax=Actinomadura gamaensis TaxID=1763541 RepID=A0ABV9TUA7_9ACTN